MRYPNPELLPCLTLPLPLPSPRLLSPRRSDGNYAAYRDLARRCGPPQACVPYLGVALADLAHLSAASSDTLDDGALSPLVAGPPPSAPLINFQKLTRMHAVWETVARCQTVPYHAAADPPEAIEALVFAADPSGRSREELLARSRALEPSEEDMESIRLAEMCEFLG